MNLLEEPKEEKLTITSSEKSFDWAIEQNHIGEDLKKRLEESNVIIIPSQGANELADTLYFPSDTTELFHFLSEKQSDNFKVEISIEEKDYKELSLHADWIILADFLVKDIVAPLLVSLLAEYVIQRAGKRIDEHEVKSKIVVTHSKNKHQIEIQYSGPASEYSEVMLKAISDFGKMTMKQQSNSKSPKRKRHSKKD